jgi:hypothetical protein
VLAFLDGGGVDQLLKLKLLLVGFSRGKWQVCTEFVLELTTPSQT